ncbi:MBL fold metallo-hydrolase [Hyphomonas sp.]|uniref:MBL fold metallo-hydrolase n=1 Tax=Hyphomonas sp. TaxID=87 RepID=UPI003D2DF169
MNVTFPNSAIVRAPERFVLRGGRWKWIDIPVRYGVFDHPVGGRCLVDTGYSSRTLRGPRSLALTLYAALLRPRLTARSLPKAEPDIDAILLTHLHADHVSALRDYPCARLYANRRAVRHFLSGNRMARLRHGVFRELLPDDLSDRILAYEDMTQIEAPLGLGKSADVFGDGSVLAVPLPGHMRGHTGFLWTDRQRPLLYAADAEWVREAITADHPPGLPAKFILDDVPASRDSAARLRRFIEQGGDVVLCHDPEPL